MPQPDTAEGAACILPGLARPGQRALPVCSPDYVQEKWDMVTAHAAAVQLPGRSYLFVWRLGGSLF